MLRQIRQTFLKYLQYSYNTFSFSSSRLSHLSLASLLHFLASISIYCLSCIYVYTCRVLKETYSLHIVLLVCMCSGVTIQHLATIVVVFPGEDHFSCFWFSSVAYSSSCSVQASQVFSIQLGIPLGVILAHRMFGQSCS